MNLARYHSGNEVRIRCTEYNFQHNQEGEIVSYNLKGISGLAKHDPFLWLSLKKIERIEIIR